MGSVRVPMYNCINMETVSQEILKQLYVPSKSSHKGMNGRLLIIGGSHLFHAASLWSLKIATRLVDLVHYASVDENNEIVRRLKEEFRDGIVIERRHIDDYIQEDDCILIGPGMMRSEAAISNIQHPISNIEDILKIEDEGIQTYFFTKYLLKRYPQKKWVIDAGALQMMELDWIPPNAILTPHLKEFTTLKRKALSVKRLEKIDTLPLEEQAEIFAQEFHCVVLLKGAVDYVSSSERIVRIEGGNAGMTKGGTGDVLAGLAAALYCKNDAFLSACAASYINKKAGEDLEKTMGLWFNASDLADQIPKTTKQLLS